MFQNYDKQKALINFLKKIGIGVLISLPICLILGVILETKTNLPNVVQIIIFVLIELFVVFLVFMVYLGNEQKKQRENKVHDEDVFKK